MLSFTAPAVTPAEALAYLTAGGATGWPSTETDQKTAIIRGQRYIAARFNQRWLTEWANDEAPEAVKYAICEAALAEAVKPGSLSPVSTPSTDKVLVQAGKLAWERVKGAGGPDGYVPRLSIVEGLLAGLVRSSTGGVHFLARA
ncbi:hypothetical protein [Pseudogemmobacter faecipullorum]|uniref:Uncharacterized protein n=1 Tax=Pseudogemmobacter faecipullorum TaxID=2755041 RepID=A0ABS8CSN2_9RHOB|nr:hypothetical protein [Pseudogemmobacter faecipullorum]MCB5411785.1 hypothetical protein [Pseudogemmobacter faecipullorum]